MSDETSSPGPDRQLARGQVPQSIASWAKGGWGVVVAATHLQLEQRVAIKFLLGTRVAKRPKP